MTRAVVDYLVKLLNDGFEENAEHSLLGNIREIDGAGWRWKPEGGARSIASVVWHASSAKYLYHSHAFGDGSVSWEHPLTDPAHARTVESALPWAREGHRLFVEGVAALADQDLATIRAVHWGQKYPLSFAVDTIIQHDLFHAGEINHIRALMQGNDRWGYFGPDPGKP